MGLHEKKVNLDDDFIKFIRWSQYHVDQAGAGIVALVTSNTYLAGLTHRGMRQSLHGSFDQLYVFDLHGDRKRDVRLDGSSRDENVFDIQQGVAVGLFVKTGRKAGVTRVFHGELKGPRTQKLAALQQGDVVTACTRQLATEEAVSFFVPNRHKAEIAYDDSPSLEQIFLHYVSGVQTKQDALLTDRSRIQLSARVRNLLDRQQAVRPVDKFKGRREPDFKSWPGHPKEAVVFDARCLRPYQVAPFDFRWLYYDPRLLGRPRWSVARHLLRPNLALVFMRQSTNAGDYDHFLASTDLVSDRVFYSGHGAPFFAPLFLDGGPPSLGDPSLDENPGVRGNLQPTFVRRVSRLWRLKFETFAHGDLERAFGARDVFDYAYAIFHSPEFRLRYRERLATGFPRLPLTADLDLARQLCVMGRRLVALHTTLPASRHADTNPWRSGGDYRIRSGYPRFDAPPVGQPQVGPPQVGPDSTSGDAGESGAADEGATGCIRINSETCLERVAEADWQFQVGGYRVIQKWLSARRGTTLGRPQRDHVADLVRISRETRALAFRIQEMLSPWPWA